MYYFADSSFSNKLHIKFRLRNLISSISLQIHATLSRFYINRYPMPHVDVLFGAHNFSNLDTSNNVTWYRLQTVYNIVIHHAYSRKTLKNDIAMLKVIHDINMSENVESVCLTWRENSFYEGKTAVVSGWGDLNGKNYSNICLQKCMGQKLFFFFLAYE